LIPHHDVVKDRLQDITIGQAGSLGGDIQGSLCSMLRLFSSSVSVFIHS
jgi:hypothetical protein